MLSEHVQVVDDVGTTTFTVTDDERGFRFLCTLPAPGDQDAAVLLPLRAFCDDEPLAQDPALLYGELVRQSTNLNQKLAAVDAIGLSDVPLGTRFTGSRGFVICPARVGGLSGAAPWEFAAAAMAMLRERTPRRVISQIDYDQRRFHSAPGGMLDSIDFRSKHDPSAIATVTVFTTLLDAFGHDPSSLVWAVKGVGELGSRIVRLLRAQGVADLIVCDIDRARLDEVARSAGATACSPGEFPTAAAQAVVFCADAGSLDEAMGTRLAALPVVVAGGPEAGLDRRREAVEALAGANVHFAPSVLCGSMGIVSNLEEAIGITPALDDQRQRLAAFTRGVIAEAVRQGRPFHEVCLDHIACQGDTRTPAGASGAARGDSPAGHDPR